ncbi:MAG: hypothetical protein V2I43_24545 [Parvularcula sp.]|jgi:hypothetical protein|nr:hypothetical protein [Parvularcula sp.]
MKSETWWDYFDEDPYEKIGRYVPNAFGKKEVVQLTRIAWAYLDWLEKEEGCDIDRFFARNDRLRTEADGCLHACMEGNVEFAFLRREKLGAKRPSWLPPAHASEYVDI